jgi:hypothetical protein
MKTSKLIRKAALVAALIITPFVFTGCGGGHGGGHFHFVPVHFFR